MNRFALLSLYRSLTRHKLYAALNIGGLAVGIAVFLILGLYVRFETSFETWLPRHQGIYLVRTEWKGMDSPFIGIYPNTMAGLLDELREDFPGIVGTRFSGGERAGSVIRGGVAVIEDVAQVDASFFKVFDLPFETGKLVARQFWHQRNHHDPGHKWLRRQIAELFHRGNGARASFDEWDGSAAAARPRPVGELGIY